MAIGALPLSTSATISPLLSASAIRSIIGSSGGVVVKRPIATDGISLGPAVGAALAPVLDRAPMPELGGGASEDGGGSRGIPPVAIAVAVVGAGLAGLLAYKMLKR